MDEKRGVATVIDQQVWAGAIRPCQHLLCAPPVLLQGLSLPGKDGRGVTGDRCCCVVLHPTEAVTDITRSLSALGHAELPRCGKCCCSGGFLRTLANRMIACKGLQSSLSHCRAGRQGAKQRDE